MILTGQRRLASEILGVGENKVWMDKHKLEDIKKAITRYDIKELIKEGTIKARIKKKVEKKEEIKKKKRRGTGSWRKKVRLRKRKYIFKIRKLRKYIEEIYAQKVISQIERKKLRVMARVGRLKSLRHLKEYLTVTMNKKLPEQKKYEEKK